MYAGTIKSEGLQIGRGFGFIALEGSPDVFFHASALSETLLFDEQLAERRVTFDIANSSKGLRAVNIRPAK